MRRPANQYTATTASTPQPRTDLEAVAKAFTRPVPWRPQLDIPATHTHYDYLVDNPETEPVWTGPEPDSYSMFTGEGDLAAGQLVTDITEAVDNGWLPPTTEAVQAAITDGVRQLQAAGHTEITDTACRESVIGTLEDNLADLGHDHLRDTLTFF